MEEEKKVYWLIPEVLWTHDHEQYRKHRASLAEHADLDPKPSGDYGSGHPRNVKMGHRWRALASRLEPVG